jgi:hypothetical protein
MPSDLAVIALMAAWLLGFMGLVWLCDRPCCGRRGSR